MFEKIKKKKIQLIVIWVYHPSEQFMMPLKFSGNDDPDICCPVRGSYISAGEIFIIVNTKNSNEERSVCSESAPSSSNALDSQVNSTATARSAMCSEKSTPSQIERFFFELKHEAYISNVQIMPFLGPQSPRKGPKS